MIKRFMYKKPSDKPAKLRTVYVLKEPSDMILGIDLTEFDPEDVEYYNAELNHAVDTLNATIANLGLSHNYRNFKPERIVNK